MDCNKGKEKIPDDWCLFESFVLKLSFHKVFSRLQKFEIPQAVHLVSELWTPESGLLTAAMKLKRKNIEEKFSEEIAQMYLQGPGSKKENIANNNG